MQSFPVKTDGHTYYFCPVSAKGMKTFARLGAPQFASLVKRAGGNLVSKFKKIKMQKKNNRGPNKATILGCNEKCAANGSLPVGVVECNRINHVPVALQSVHVGARGRVPNSTCPVIAPSYEPGEKPNKQ